MIARYALREIFKKIGRTAPDVSLRVEFADGSVVSSGPDQTKPDIAIWFKKPRAERRALIFFYEGIFEGYVEGEIDLDGDRPIAALARIGYAQGMVPVSYWSRFLRNPINGLRQWAQELAQSNTNRQRSIRNADFHYAVDPVLFEHMLGETVGYSEGLWTPQTRTLNQAKYNTYEYVCRKLRLAPGLKVLEVGSGWGYMPIYMATRYGVDVTVYNPVDRQNAYMRERFRRHDLGDAIRVVDGDHRDIVREAGRFDRFVSIGVHEHAGYSRRQYRLWARSIAAALKTGGLGVVSTTSLMSRQMTNMLTLKYIFPGGHLPSLPDTLTAFDAAGLMMVEVENLWPHYRQTARRWRDNIEAHWPEIQAADPAVFTERFRRIWTMYLEGTDEVFGDSLDLSHIVFAKGRSADHFPWTPGERPAADFMGGDREPECYR